ncbi:MAG: VWA domain-containing protein [Gemmatimonadetes bacterium]|nr:VWA domain-containing protein [Gemmatimonadota bacterium]
MRPTSLTLALAAATIVARGATAQGILIDPQPRCGPTQDCMVRAPMQPQVERTASVVRIDLVNGVARYEVTETFVNRGARLGEADYLYPLPKGAAFTDLKLSINGELVSGETMNAQQARQVYEQIVAKQRDPALVEWMGYGLLRTRIFPIAPGEEKKVVVRFSQVAEREGDALRLDYFRGPTTTGPRERPNMAPTGRMRFVLSYSADAPYGRPYSPTHDVQARRDGDRQVVEIEGGARELTVLLPVRQGREAAISMLPQADGSDARYALVTLTPPVVNARRTPRDVTFVIDISGSMSGRKLEQAKAAGRQLLATLGEGDRFRIIPFASDVRSFRDGWSEATREELGAARNYIDGLEVAGGTNIMGALREATRVGSGEGRLPIVLFLTDGAPSVGEQRADVIADSARAWRGGRRVFTFGLGSDVNVSLLEQLALSGRGTAQFARPEEDVERMVGITASRLVAPVVTDLRMHAEGVRLVRTMPQDAQDLFAGQDLVVLTQYEGTGRGTLVFEGRTTNGPVRWTQNVSFPDRETANGFVPRLWATQRIGWLAAEKRRTGTSELDGEIRTLGEKFGIPTEFTSYLVLEPGMTVASNQPVPLGLRRDVDRLSRQAGSGGNAMGLASPAAAPAEARFELAKEASAQRAAKSLAVLDAANDARGANEKKMRATAGRSFVLVGDTWTDSRAKDQSLPVVKVKSYSAAYFALVRALPQLKDAFALGDRVTIVGKGLVLQVAPDGVDTLKDAELERVRKAVE